MKRRGGQPVTMIRCADIRRCPECHKTMRLSKCADCGAETLALPHAPTKPLAV